MRASVIELPTLMDNAPAARVRAVDWGGMTCARFELGPGRDIGPLLKGLPGDCCPVPHWGYVLEGSLTIRYADGREETLRAGDLYHLPPGHTARTEEGVTYVEFSPAREMGELMAHIRRQSQG